MKIEDLMNLKSIKKTMVTSENPINYLRKTAKEPFTLRAANTSSKYTLVSFDGQNAYTDIIIYMPDIKHIKKRNLGVISHVKAKAKIVEPYMPDVDKFSYTGVYPLPRNQSMWKGYEIDVVSAYWREAYLRGLCSEEMYNKFLHGKDRKLARNMAIGACNSTKHLFDIYPDSMGGKNEDVYLETIEPYAPKTYRIICKEVVTMLNEIAQNCKTPLFYWVDQVYVSGKISRKKIDAIAAKYGHTVKIKEVFITKKSDSFLVNCGKEIRPFSIR